MTQEIKSFRPKDQEVTIYYVIENNTARIVNIVFDKCDNVDYDGKGNVIPNDFIEM